MKKTIYFILATMVVFSIWGCKKVWNYINPHGPGGVAQQCRISKVTYKDSSLYSDRRVPIERTVEFIYDESANLIQIKQEATGSVFFPDSHFDSYFKYDNQNRLRRFLTGAGPVDLDPEMIYATFWHRYSYIDGYNIIDTIWEYAAGYSLDDHPQEDDYPPIAIEHIKLDRYGRVVQVEKLSPTGVPETTTNYAYNAAGNLIMPGATYTDKLNIYQTNKTLMFVYRDYSVNDRIGNTISYNGQNLPEKIDPNGTLVSDLGIVFANENWSEFSGSPYFFYYEMDHDIRVSYECR